MQYESAYTAKAVAEGHINEQKLFSEYTLNDLMDFAVLVKRDNKYVLESIMTYDEFLAWHSPEKKLTHGEGETASVTKYNIVSELTMWTQAPPLIGSRYQTTIDRIHSLKEYIASGSRMASREYMFICLKKGDTNWEQYAQETQKVSTVKYGSLIGHCDCSGSCSSSCSSGDCKH